MKLSAHAQRGGDYASGMKFISFISLNNRNDYETLRLLTSLYSLYLTRLDFLVIRSVIYFLLEHPSSTKNGVSC